MFFLNKSLVATFLKLDIYFKFKRVTKIRKF